MNGCFDFFNGNCCLWIGVILLIICLCKSGCLNGLFNSCYCLPLALLLICCCGKGNCLCGKGGGYGFGCK